MHPTLTDIIDRFRAAQDRGVAAVVEVLGPTLGIRLPASNREWVMICGERGLWNIRWVNGIQVYAHGYGIELGFRDLTIDFDWGDEGEPDGFDAWRLWNFASVNQLDVVCERYSNEGYSKLQAWLEQAYQSGELTRDRLLYYSPAHRAPLRSVAGGDPRV